MDFDAIIIGGGIIGITSAIQLNKAGMRVAIIDKGELGKQASWAAGGILSSLCPWEQNDACLSLTQRSEQLFPELANTLLKETNIDPQLITSGMIILDPNEEQAGQWLKENNDNYEKISKQQLKNSEPNLRPRPDNALLLPSVMQIRPPCLLQALKVYLKKLGITIFKQNKAYRLLIQANTVQGVETANSNLFAEHVIVCNGAWAKELLSQNNMQPVDIQPKRGQMLLYPAQDKTINHIIINQGRYIIPRKDGQVLCGSTVEDVGFNNDTTVKAATELHQFAQKLFPHLAQNSASHHWAALRPGTQRMTPYICKHPELSGLYLNTGHFRYGILMSLASAEILCDLIKNKLSTSQIESYAY